jgi:hypothetical protein
MPNFSWYPITDYKSYRNLWGDGNHLVRDLALQILSRYNTHPFSDVIIMEFPRMENGWNTSTPDVKIHKWKNTTMLITTLPEAAWGVFSYLGALNVDYFVTQGLPFDSTIDDPAATITNYPALGWSNNPFSGIALYRLMLDDLNNVVGDYIQDNWYVDGGNSYDLWFSQSYDDSEGTHYPDDFPHQVPANVFKTLDDNGTPIGYYNSEGLFYDDFGRVSGGVCYFTSKEVLPIGEAIPENDATPEIDAIPDSSNKPNRILLGTLPAIKGLEASGFESANGFYRKEGDVYVNVEHPDQQIFKEEGLWLFQVAVMDIPYYSYDLFSDEWIKWIDSTIVTGAQTNVAPVWGYWKHAANLPLHVFNATPKPYILAKEYNGDWESYSGTYAVTLGGKTITDSTIDEITNDDEEIVTADNEPEQTTKQWQEVSSAIATPQPDNLDETIQVYYSEPFPQYGIGWNHNGADSDIGFASTFEMLPSSFSLKQWNEFALFVLSLKHRRAYSTGWQNMEYRTGRGIETTLEAAYASAYGSMSNGGGLVPVPHQICKVVITDVGDDTLIYDVTVSSGKGKVAAQALANRNPQWYHQKDIYVRGVAPAGAGYTSAYNDNGFDILENQFRREASIATTLDNVSIDTTVFGTTTGAGMPSSPTSFNYMEGWQAEAISSINWAVSGGFDYYI